MSILEEIFSSFIAYLPTLLGALLLLAVGWGLARLAQRAIARLGDRLFAFVARLFAGTPVENIRMTTRTASVLGDIAFAIVLLIFIAAAARVAEVPAFSSWLDRVIAYLPQLVTGAMIVGVGILIGMVVRDLVAGTFVGEGEGQRRLLSRLLQASVVAVAIVMAIDQVGIDATLLVVLVSIVGGALAFGLAVAFGLGARHFVENLLAARNLRHMCQIGQAVQFGSWKGRIVEVTATAVVLETKTERVAIPARLFDEQIVVLPVEGESDG